MVETENYLSQLRRRNQKDSGCKGNFREATLTIPRMFLDWICEWCILLRMAKPKRILIRVTKEHIALGVRHSCKRCPIALAMIAGGVFMPEAGVDFLKFFLKPTNLTSKKAPASRKVRQFIFDFDKQRPVRPFRFFLKPL